MKKINVKTIVICIVCLVGLIFTFVYSKSAKKRGGFARPKREASAVSVRTVKAEIRTLHDYVKTNGEIECESSVDAFADIGGKVAKVYVSLGDRVNKNDVLAEVDPSEPGARYVYSKVYAPIKGTITSIPKEIGSRVSTSTAITTVGDVTNLQVRAKIPERYVAALRVGLCANVVLQAYPDEVFNATVKRISPVVDVQSRTKEVILTFDKKDSRINAGMFASIKLFTLNYTGSVTIPSSAIVEKNDSLYVFVVNEDGKTVSLREVLPGSEVDGEVQLLMGVKEGERVVYEGMRSLAEGSEIVDVENPSAVNDDEMKDMNHPDGDERKDMPKPPKHDGRKGKK